MSSRKHLLLFATLGVAFWAALVVVTRGAVPTGSAPEAEEYYKDLAETLEFQTPDTILSSSFDDLTAYLGYAGLSGIDLEQIASDVLMDRSRLGKPCAGQPCETAVQNPDGFRRNFSALPMRAGDILASRFFAPKIADMSKPAEKRQAGWRKLVRLRARSGSLAKKNNISDGIILFNFFTDPGKAPFAADAESVNTQVMLLTSRSAFITSLKTDSPRDSLYWLDYDPLSKGGTLSLKLNAAFDAGDLQGRSSAFKDYFVPTGCVACHGENGSRPMVNYLDTDHWFDRLDDDFTRVRDDKLPVIFDGGLDTSTPKFARAFDVIRKFNQEAESHAAFAQPRSFHRRAGQKWLQLHQTSTKHFLPVQRAVRVPGVTTAGWNPKSEADRELITALNRYCFRCHGTIRFNVFEKDKVLARLSTIANQIDPTPEHLNDEDFLMPPDRVLSRSEKDRIIQLLNSVGAK